MLERSGGMWISYHDRFSGCCCADTVRNNAVACKVSATDHISGTGGGNSTASVFKEGFFIAVCYQFGTGFSAIFYELLGNLDTYCISRNNTMFKQGDLLFNRFIELLSKSKVKVRSVSFYADKLFITTKYLSVICKQVCGKTAFDIINEFIIEDITELLKYSEKSIKEIANYLEFPNLSYFGKYVNLVRKTVPRQKDFHGRNLQHVRNVRGTHDDGASELRTSN